MGYLLLTKKSSFRDDPFYFGRHYLGSIAVVGSITVFLLVYVGHVRNVSIWWFLSLIPLFLERFRFVLLSCVALLIVALYSYWPELSWSVLFGVLISIYVGCLTAVFIHNASHNNFKPIWLNSVVGELCSLQQLSAGFQVFRVIHNAHHAGPDDPEKDPHPPKGYKLFEFIDSARVMIGMYLGKLYFKYFGTSEVQKRLWKKQSILLVISRFVKTLFWFCLLGPKFFVLFYLPSYLANVFLFACFNFYTHREKEDGTVEILNLNEGLFLKCVNFFLFGTMFHKNHHLRPKFFNPKYI